MTNGLQMVVLAFVCRKFKPKNIFRLEASEHKIQKRTPKEMYLELAILLLDFQVHLQVGIIF
jgi:L-lactate permease